LRCFNSFFISTTDYPIQELEYGSAVRHRVSLLSRRCRNPSSSPGDERAKHLMPLYRCHFLDSRDHIEAYEEIETGTLLDAIDRANEMLKERPHHNAVEVWAGNRWIYRAAREGNWPPGARAD
jgi:hypothetical protein